MGEHDPSPSTGKAIARTDWSRDSLTFSSLGPERVVANCLGGRRATDAGALVLRAVERPLGLFQAPDDGIPDPRQPELIAHDPKARLAQRISAIAAGSEGLNDHQTRRTDPGLRLTAGRDPTPEPPCASPSTPCPGAWKTGWTARPWSRSLAC